MKKDKAKLELLNETLVTNTVTNTKTKMVSCDDDDDDNVGEQSEIVDIDDGTNDDNESFVSASNKKQPAAEVIQRTVKFPTVVVTTSTNSLDDIITYESQSLI